MNWWQINKMFLVYFPVRIFETSFFITLQIILDANNKFAFNTFDICDLDLTKVYRKDTKRYIEKILLNEKH